MNISLTHRYRKVLHVLFLCLLAACLLGCGSDTSDERVAEELAQDRKDFLWLALAAFLLSVLFFAISWLISFLNGKGPDLEGGDINVSGGFIIFGFIGFVLSISFVVGFPLYAWMKTNTFLSNSRVAGEISMAITAGIVIRVILWIYDLWDRWR